MRNAVSEDTTGRVRITRRSVRHAVVDHKMVVFLIAILGLALRLGVKLTGVTGAVGYTFYWGLAQNILSGNGLCTDATSLGWFVIGGEPVDILGRVCAHITPGYPLFLALSLLGGTGLLWWVIPQAVISIGTVIGAYLIGKLLFDRLTGVLASLFVALYPYYVWHDTALQDTSIHVFLITTSVVLLLQAKRSHSLIISGLAGVTLGVGILVKGTLVPFTIIAVLWLLVFGAPVLRIRVRKAATVGVISILVLSPWVLRNWVLLGAPVLTTQGGLYFWQANHDTSFLCFPEQDMDCSLPQAWSSLSATDKAELQQLAGNEVAQDSWFARKGAEYVWNHPVQTVERAIRKVMIAFSWKFYPYVEANYGQETANAKTPLALAVYTVSYVPMLILGLIGMVRARRSWRDHILIYAMFLMFVGATVIFKGYVSYRSHLDVQLMVFAASVLRFSVTSSGIRSLPVWAGKQGPS